MNYLELRDYLYKTKNEILEDNLIPTLDEVIERVNNLIEGDHDCHASPEDGCKGCDLLGVTK